jgi:HSP20 family protein
MAELNRWDPFRDPISMLETMNRLFDDRLFLRRRGEGEAMSNWSPLVDIYEDSEGVTLTAELPGVDPKAVELKIEDGVLTISGERKLDHADQRQNYQKIERWYGTFSRSFSLPPTVDVEKVRAEHKQGVLTVFLPRKEETKPRRIVVKVE